MTTDLDPAPLEPVLRDRRTRHCQWAMAAATILRAVYVLFTEIQVLLWLPGDSNRHWWSLLLRMLVWGLVLRGIFSPQRRWRFLFAGICLTGAAAGANWQTWQIVGHLTAYAPAVALWPAIVAAALLCSQAYGLLCGWEFFRREIEAGHSRALTAAAVLPPPTAEPPPLEVGPLTAAPADAAWFQRWRLAILAPLVYALALSPVLNILFMVASATQAQPFESRWMYLAWSVVNLGLVMVVTAGMLSNRVQYRLAAASASAGVAIGLIVELPRELGSHSGPFSAVVRLLTIRFPAWEISARVGLILGLLLLSLGALYLAVQYVGKLDTLLTAGHFHRPEPTDPAAIEVSGWDEGSQPPNR